MELKLDEYQESLFNNYVENAEAYKLGHKTTVVIITLFSGFEIVGTSACVNPNDFNEEIGAHYALVDALNKLDELAGFLRQEQQFGQTHNKG